MCKFKRLKFERSKGLQDNVVQQDLRINYNRHMNARGAMRTAGVNGIIMRMLWKLKGKIKGLQKN